MGFFMNALKKAVGKQVKQHFRTVSKNNCASSQKMETPEDREIREKQKIAEDIRKQAKEQSKQHLKIVQDCVELVNTTVNPEVFFMRYNLMLEHLEKLVGLECTGIYANSPELPSVVFQRVDEQFESQTIIFLDRSFEKAKEHAETLKTESGKKNAIKRYFDNMSKYTDRMGYESREFFERMKAENLIE